MERLDKIRREVEKAYHCDIMDRSRRQYITDSRIVFANVAKKFKFKTVEIAKYLGKHHATIVHYHKCWMTADMAAIVMNVYEACLADNELISHLIGKINNMDYLTENEKRYRGLTDKQKRVYDERVSNLLKMI